MAELDSMAPRPSHYAPGQEIPEKSWFYRFAKKHFFNDFGAYAGKTLPPPPAARQSEPGLSLPVIQA